MSLNAIEQRVCQSIELRADSMLDDLKAHVAIPTGHGYAPGLAQYREALARRLADLGAKVQTIQGRTRPTWITPSKEDQSDSGAPTPQPILLAKSSFTAGSPRVLIVGHIDTVHDPTGDFQSLTVSPDRKTAIGPGAVDMKGGILVALNALRALRDADVKLIWTFLLNADEETGSFESDAVLREHAAMHDFGIVVEPALPGGALAIERMGSGQFMIEVFGRAAHVGREFARGVSAVNALAKVISALEAMADPDRGLIVNVGPLQGGHATNVVADYAACWGNVRFASPAAADELARSIDALATAGDALPRVVVQRIWNRPAKPKTPQVEALADAARVAAEDLGQSLPFVSTGGVCDGNILQEAGLPTLDTLGVRGGNLHRTDEFVEISSLVERAQLLAVLLCRIASRKVTIAVT